MTGKQQWQDVTLLVGNGLGMELDSEYFSLSQALDNAWGDSTLNLCEQFKDFCRKFSTDDTLPNDENQISDMHLFFDSLNRIKDMGRVYDNKIDRELFNFTKEYCKLSHFVAKHFSEYEKTRSDKYQQYQILVDSLRAFIKSNYTQFIKVNIFTTNYDNLLYKEFLNDRDIFAYDVDSCKLVDGFSGNNDKGHPIFDPNNIWRNEGKHGLYVHLHGNPYFYVDKRGKICKSSTKEVFPMPTINHIVLCSPSQKTRQITSSSLLQSYFEAFQYRIKTSNIIILFGYNGLDDHINDTIKRLKKSGSKIYIIEWEHSHFQRKMKEKYLESKVEEFWRSRLIVDYIEDFICIPKQSILDFNFEREIDID